MVVDVTVISGSWVYEAQVGLIGFVEPTGSHLGVSTSVLSC